MTLKQKQTKLKALKKQLEKHSIRIFNNNILKVRGLHTNFYKTKNNLKARQKCKACDE